MSPAEQKMLETFYRNARAGDLEAQNIIAAEGSGGMYEGWLQLTSDGAGWPVVLISCYRGYGNRWTWDQRWTVEVFGDAAEAAATLIQRVKVFDSSCR